MHSTPTAAKAQRSKPTLAGGMRECSRWKQPKKNKKR